MYNMEPLLEGHREFHKFNGNWGYVNHKADKIYNALM